MGESLLEVKTRIQTVESIRKITNAMKLIANSRYNQLKNLYDGNLAYMEEIKEAMELCLLYVDYSKTARPTCLVQNPGNKKLYIFVTSTLGLCGSYYNNLSKLASKVLTKNDDVIFIGEKGYRHYKDKVHRAYKRFIHLLDNFSYTKINLFRHQLDELYRQEGYSSINIIYTAYINSMTTKCVCKKILPLDGEKIVREKKEKLAQAMTDEYLNIVNGYLEATWSGEAIEFMKKGVSKANALKKLIDVLKLERNEVAVIGDSGNDVSMFKEFEHSFVMSHAPEEIKKFASTVVDNVYDLKNYIMKE